MAEVHSILATDVATNLRVLQGLSLRLLDTGFLAESWCTDSGLVRDDS